MIKKMSITTAAMILLLIFSLATVSADGPTNVVDATDYTIWRNNLIASQLWNDAGGTLMGYRTNAGQMYDTTPEDGVAR